MLCFYFNDCITLEPDAIEYLINVSHIAWDVAGFKPQSGQNQQTKNNEF